MIRIRFATVLAVLLLAGCAAAPSRDAFPRHYALTGIAAPQPPRPSEAAHWTIRVDAIAAPIWLNGTRMHYRLGYLDHHEVAAYAESDWVAPPARMLESLVRRALAASGDWRAVIGPGDPAQANFVLRIRLDAFDQPFTSPTQSDGVLDLTATLTGAHAGPVLAQRRFTVRVAAPTADAAGGVAALNDASARFTAELEAWLHAVAAATPPDPG